MIKTNMIRYFFIIREKKEKKKKKKKKSLVSATMRQNDLRRSKNTPLILNLHRR